MNSRATAFFLYLLTLFTVNANSQHLFGNPSCKDWKNISLTEKKNMDKCISGAVELNQRFTEKAPRR
jgi:hypothetical protein